MDSTHNTILQALLKGSGCCSSARSNSTRSGTIKYPPTSVKFIPQIQCLPV